MHWCSSQHPQLTPSHKSSHIVACIPTTMEMIIKAFGCTQSCVMLTLFPTNIRWYSTMDHFKHATIQVHPRWLPNTQPSPLPQVPLVFLSTHSSASPVIQAAPPGSLDAILLLATTVFDAYFPAVLSHYTFDPYCIPSSSNCSLPKGFSYPGVQQMSQTKNNRIQDK